MMGSGAHVRSLAGDMLTCSVTEVMPGSGARARSRARGAPTSAVAEVTPGAGAQERGLVAPDQARARGADRAQRVPRAVLPAHHQGAPARAPRESAQPCMPSIEVCVRCARGVCRMPFDSISF